MSRTTYFIRVCKYCNRRSVCCVVYTRCSGFHAGSRLAFLILRLSALVDCGNKTWLMVGRSTSHGLVCSYHASDGPRRMNASACPD